MPDTAKFCPSCGTAVDSGKTGMIDAHDYTEKKHNNNTAVTEEGIEISPKNWLAALLLEIFLGVLGIHRFYVGKIGTGILWLLTAGIFGIGWIVDLVMIVCGNFKDKQDRYLKSENWKQSHLIIEEVKKTSSPDELLKWKQLLDDGVITQEEFDAKKTELLNQ